MKTFKSFLSETNSSIWFSQPAVDSQHGNHDWARELGTILQRPIRSMMRERINPKSVIPTQIDLESKRVKELVDSWPEDDFRFDHDNPIVIYLKDGKPFIADGHHRLAAAIQLGKQPYGVVVKFTSRRAMDGASVS